MIGTKICVDGYQATNRFVATGADVMLPTGEWVHTSFNPPVDIPAGRQLVVQTDDRGRACLVDLATPA